MDSDDDNDNSCTRDACATVVAGDFFAAVRQAFAGSDRVQYGAWSEHIGTGRCARKSAIYAYPTGGRIGTMNDMIGCPVCAYQK